MCAMGMLDGKTAYITGAARGQGRAHAVRLASEGANIVAVDLDHDLETVPYHLATAADMQETVDAVTRVGGKILAGTADVRSQRQLDESVARGVEQFGRIDICVANAGILSMGRVWELDEAQWTQM